MQGVQEQFSRFFASLLHAFIGSLNAFLESTSLLLGVVLRLVLLELFPFIRESFTCFAALLDEIDKLQRIASDETVNV